jgi:adenylate cyclase
MTAEPIELKTKSSAPRNPSLGYVLIVDDEEQNRTLLRDPLEAKGYELGEAENGEEALRMIAARVPDVILLDVMMPRLDGFETCRRLKLNPATASVPILMVTALSERKERLMGIQCGANDFLTKPVDFQDVVLRVGNAAYTKRLFDQLQAEREKSEQLLLNVIPAAVCKRMKNGEVNIADSHAEVSVLFADLVGFTTLSSQIDADQVVFLLNEIFSEFDLLAEKHGVEKIKTIGDGYLAAGGVPVARPDHAEAIAALALDMQAEIARINHDYNTSIHIRVGICSGPVVAGVIGRKKFAYDIWGATVNLAHELEKRF